MIELQFSQLTDIGCVRKANEDNMGHAEVPNGQLYIVCDGMGGHVGGATASSIAVQSITEYFSRDKYENPFNALLKAIEYANTRIFNHAQSNPELKGMGITAVVLLKQEDEFYIGHVGDSRIYLRSSGKLHRITKDHSFVQGLVEQGIIADSEAESHPRKNELTKALGIRPNVEPTICSKPIKPASKDTFLLCSDGLCGLVNDPTLNSIMAQAETTESATHQLIEAARNAGGHDNITAQLIHIVSSPFEKSEFEDYTPQENLSTGNFGNSHTQTMDMEAEPSVNKKKKIIIYSAIGVLFLLIAIWYFIPNDNKSKNDLETIQNLSPENTFLTIIVSEENIVVIEEEDTLTTMPLDTQWKKLIYDLKTENVIDFYLCSQYCMISINGEKPSQMPCKQELKPGMTVYAVNEKDHIDHKNNCCPDNEHNSNSENKNIEDQEIKTNTKSPSKADEINKTDTTKQKPDKTKVNEVVKDTINKP